MTKRRIAVAIAALFLGAQVGIAALEPEAARSPESEAALDIAEQHAADYQTATAEIADGAESSGAAAPAEAAADAEAPEPSAGTETTDAASQPAEAAAPAPTAAAPMAAAPREPATTSPVAASEQPATWWEKVRAAVASFFDRVRVVLASATPAPTFPDGDETAEWHLPSTIAYLDEVERERAAEMRNASWQSAFPMGADDASPLLFPSQIAYFDRLERERAAESHAAANGSPFPMASEDSAWAQPLPSQVAPVERERLAKESALQTAQADAAATR